MNKSGTLDPELPQPPCHSHDPWGNGGSEKLRPPVRGHPAEEWGAGPLRVARSVKCPFFGFLLYSRGRGRGWGWGARGAQTPHEAALPALLQEGAGWRSPPTPPQLAAPLPAEA